MNKRYFILVLLVLLILGLLSGCGSNLPEGFENKKFLKDLDKISDLALKSMSEQKYYEDEINDRLDDMIEYKEDLNDYEILILDSLIESLKKVKKDLTTGEKVVQSTTFEKIKTIREMIKN